MDGHSVSWVRSASSRHLAGVALAADTWLAYLDTLDSIDAFRQHYRSLARDKREQAVRELVRRGDLERFGFVAAA